MWAQMLPLLTALLAVGVLGYAAVEGNQALMAAAAVLLAALTTSLRGLVRWLALLAYPLAFVAFLLLHPESLALEAWPRQPW
ncbi:hypothetical protein [Deinococcus radiophilus]|uniref:hypothetical protein n=1 Tax=Deinococcus radiophilus TaxID=32062 RepID=UPI00361E9A03